MKNLKKCLLGISAVLSLLVSCTKEKKSLPSEAKYQEQTNLMFNICNKFASEPDGKKLNKAAVATQTARVVSCFDYNNECVLYGKFLSSAIELTKDGEISTADSSQLKAKLQELKKAIDEGKEKLHQELL